MSEKTNPSALYPAEWTLWTKRVAMVSLLGASIYALTFIGPVLQLIVVSMLLSLLFFTPAQWLTRRIRLPYALSVLLVFTLYFSFITYAFLRLGPPIADAINGWRSPIERTVTDVVTFFREYTPERGILVLGTDPANAPRIDLNFLLEPVSRTIKGEGEAISNPLQALQSLDVLGIARNIANAAGGLLNGIGTLVFAHFLALLILLEFPSLYRSFIRLDDHWEREYVILIRRVYRVWEGFFQGQVLIGLIVGVATWLQLVTMGVPAAVLVGVAVGILSLIPTIGSLIGLIPIALAPLLGGSSVLVQVDRVGLTALVIVINMALIQGIVFNVIAPKITGGAVALPLPVVIVGLFIGTAFGGILGALLIAPLLGTIRLVVDYTLLKIRGGDPFPGEERPNLVLDDLFNPHPATSKATAR